jgi:hypothetical protein
MLFRAGGSFPGDRRTAEVFPLAPSVVVNQSLHTAPFGDFAFEPHKVNGLECGQY